MSENAEIYAAFVCAQRGFAPALKTSANPFFKSKYANLSTCIEAVMDSLHQNDIAVLQKTHKDDTGVTVETVFIHASGESMSGGELHVPAPKNDPQGYGSALSYARRYSLMAACGIAAEDDDGQAATDKMKDKPEKLASFKTIVANDLADASDAERERLGTCAMALRAMFEAGDYEAAIAIVKGATGGDPTQVNILRGLGDKDHWKALGVYRAKLKADATKLAQATAVAKMNAE